MRVNVINVVQMFIELYLSSVCVGTTVCCVSLHVQLPTRGADHELQFLHFA